MADVFQEVDEIMRQERLQKFWNDYASWIIAFVLLTVIMTGAFSIYNSWNARVQEQQTAALITAMEDTDFASKAEALAADLRPDLRAVALMSAASNYVASENIAAALPLYNQVKEDGSIDRDIRDLASILFVRATLETNAEADLDALKSELGDVWRNDNSPWQYHAHMEMALIFAAQEGDFKSARSHLKEILASDSLPSSLYEKASALDHVYEIMAKDAAPAAETDDKTSTNGEG